MPPGPTTCTFANTIKSRGFDFTFGPGVLPSVCMLYTVPHTESLPNVGELRFQTLGEPAFTFRDCLLEEPRLIAGEQGQQWVLPIKDRRWKWQFGIVTGHHNQQRSDGSYRRELTPQDLAAKCLTEMGETNYDVSRLPNDVRPEVLWETHNPAAELDRLCADLGCIVILNPFTDGVEIWPVGQGVALPSGSTRGTSYAPVYRAQPRQIFAETGPTLFQALFKTEAVGLDIDGQWKPIDQLSYKPVSGWQAPLNGYTEGMIPGTYNSGGRTLKKHDLATATVFRCYRINALADKTPNTPSAFTLPAPHNSIIIESLRDFEFRDELADEEIGPDGGLRPLPAVVYVSRWQSYKPVPATEPVRYTESFSFDSTLCIISFNEPLVRFANGDPIPATVRFECAFHAKQQQLEGAYTTHAVGPVATGSSVTTPDRWITRGDIQHRVIFRYASDTNITVDENTAAVDAKLQKWMDVALAEYGLQNGGTVRYQKLMEISPDGLTQQVTWSGGGGRPATTIASQAQRHNRYITPPQEYRDRLSAKRAEQFAQFFALRAALRFIGGGVT